MKSLLILLAFSAIVLSSCTTAYKSGQTPDDVYFSPERPQSEYVRVDNDDDDRSYSTNDRSQYYEERQLRMKVRNRTRWSELDDWYYYNNRYSYYGNYNPVSWNNPWSNYTSWNYYYNPYSPKGYVIVNSKTTPTYNKPRTFNLNTYIPTSGNSSMGNTKTRSVDNYSNKNSNNSYNTNSRRDAGSTLRDIFRSSGSNNSSNSSGSSNNNSSSSSSGSSNSSSSGSSGGSAPVRKF